MSHIENSQKKNRLSKKRVMTMTKPQSFHGYATHPWVKLRAAETQD